MPSIKNLEMAAAVSAYNNISIRKSVFSTKVLYAPTQSPVKAIVQKYSILEGKRLLQLLDMPIEQMLYLHKAKWQARIDKDRSLPFRSVLEQGLSILCSATLPVWRFQEQ